jgi:lycopene cyclase-like protein
MDAKQTFDVLVVGGGPAGMSLAAEAGQRGLDVGLLAPSHPPEWPNNYGAWRDAFPDETLASRVEASWPRPVVTYADGTSEALDRTYVRIDNEALRDALLERCDAGGVEWVTGWAAGLEHDIDRSYVLRRERSALETSVVVDATGPGGALLRTAESREPALQTAHGILARCEGEPLGGAGMAFMDYARDHLPADASDDVPSFLYGMHLGGDRYFLEETRLAGRPPVAHQRLESRLERRLRARGVEVREVLETERVSIPMDATLPDRDQRTLGFGAAAGMIHPASGFSVTRSLRRAPEVGEALADALGSGASSRRAVHIGWRAVWPDELLRTRRLHLFGLEAMLEMEPDRLSRFFRTFFSLSNDDWAAYMSGETSPSETAGIMLRLFRRAPFDVKRGLASTSLSSSLQHVVDGLLDPRRSN